MWSFHAHFRSGVNYISHGFYSLPEFPLANALSYNNEIKQKLEQNQVEQDKQNPDLCLYFYIIYAWHCIEEHLVCTSQM